MSDKQKVVSFSGGRTSAYLSYLMKKMHADDVHFVFMDTGFEHPKTYEFVRKVNSEFKLNLICLRTDFDTPLGEGNKHIVVDIDDICLDMKPFKDMMQKYGVPYIGGMFCTDRMKLVPFKKYCNEKYGKGNYETWLGIRADEPKRINKTSGFKYLADISEFEKDDILDFWKSQSFDLGLPEYLGNCVFCPKKSNLKLASAHRDEPLIYKQFITALNSDSVRNDNKTGHWSKMYRGSQSLEQLIKTFDGLSDSEIKTRIRGSKAEDTGSCSESCEIFGDINNE